MAACFQQASNIPVPHGFTTRLGGVSTGIYASMNIAHHRGDTPENVDRNLAILAQQVGFPLKNLVLSHQVHGDVIRVVTKADALGTDHHLYPACDGLLTDDPGTALLVYTADCTPILLWDSRTGAVGAVHAGWRGTALAIAGKAVAKMAEAFGSRPRDIHAAIGPNIGFCCFETEEDVPQALESALGSWVWAHIRPRSDRFTVDLKAINAHLLRSQDVENITLSDQCTMCAPQLFWSHRVTRGQRGSQGAVILCQEKHL